MTFDAMINDVSPTNCKGIAFGLLFRNLDKIERVSCKQALENFILSQISIKYSTKSEGNTKGFNEYPALLIIPSLLMNYKIKAFDYSTNLAMNILYFHWDCPYNIFDSYNSH